MKLHLQDNAELKREKSLPEKGNLPGEVHVWSHAIHFDDAFLREAPYLLSEEEMQRASKYHFEKDKRVYEAGHVFIRKVLSHYTSINPSKLDVTPLVNQKPKLNNAPFKIHFNISHSGNKILVAVGFDSDVGIDVEHIMPDFDMDGFAEANYHPNELAHFQSFSSPEDTDYFYRIWTRKEAYLKLTGEGVNDKLRELDFSGKVSSLQLKPHGHHDLYMMSWKETDDYMATLASYIAPKNVKIFSSEFLITDTIPDY